LETLFRSWTGLPAAPNNEYADENTREPWEENYGSETRKSTTNTNEIKQELNLQHAAEAAEGEPKMKLSRSGHQLEVFVL
jgi:hypothetical protein